MLLIIIFMVAGMLVQMMLKSRMNTYSTVRNSLGLSGKEIAETMLREHGISDVQVMSTVGELTDHYNPSNKTVNLSNTVYSSNSITAAAIAAHECGHAVQHATAYSLLGFRSRMVPILNITSRIMPFLLMFGVGLFVTGFRLPLYLGIAFYGLTTIFAVITLPVEFDASARALKWLQNKGLTGDNYDMARDGLKWAALTYVAAALASIAQLMYYLQMVMGSRRNDD